MALHELYEGCRTYRRFEQRSIKIDDLHQIMENARLASCANNRQLLKYYVVTDSNLRNSIADIIHFAAALPKEIGEPKENERAMAYIVITRPSDPNAFSDIDVGIVANMIATSAWEMGIGSCLMLNFNVTEMNRLLELNDSMTARLVVALGYPAHKSTVVEMPADGNTVYTVDENVDYYVPKRTVDELTIWK